MDIEHGEGGMDSEVHIVLSSGTRLHCRQVCGPSVPFGILLHVVHDTRMQPGLRFLYRMSRPVKILAIRQVSVFWLWLSWLECRLS